jgi:ribonuclease VapC
MIIDTSAVLAILLAEAEREDFTRAIAGAARPRLPAPAYLECCLKRPEGDRRGTEARLMAMLANLTIETVPFTAAHAAAAVAARERFGPVLNFGDCMVYAVAKLADAPLLYKGGDFARTDVRSALAER